MDLYLGWQRHNQCDGHKKGYGHVWYPEGGIANILSLAKVKSKYHVTFDSGNTNEFVVHKSGGTHWFKQSARGIYYFDVVTSDVSLINTVSDNKSK